jgi:hypothetical protein
MINPIGEPECRHAFHVFRPSLAQLGQGLRRRRRLQLLATLKVSQQQRFVTGPLPDYSYARSLRDGGNLHIAKRRLTQAIIINEHRPMHVRGLALTFTLGNAFSSEFNECQWISAARLEQDHVQVHIAASVLEQATDKCPIAALALSFAT